MRQNGETVSPMSNEGRNTYVTEHITKSLLALLKDKAIEDISISELCGSAGVGRASFTAILTVRKIFSGDISISCFTDGKMTGSRITTCLSAR